MLAGTTNLGSQLRKLWRHVNHLACGRGTPQTTVPKDSLFAVSVESADLLLHDNICVKRPQHHLTQEIENRLARTLVQRCALRCDHRPAPIPHPIVAFKSILGGVFCWGSNNNNIRRTGHTRETAQATGIWWHQGVSGRGRRLHNFCIIFTAVLSRMSLYFPFFPFSSLLFLSFFLLTSSRPLLFLFSPSSYSSSTISVTISHLCNLHRPHMWLCDTLATFSSSILFAKCVCSLLSLLLYFFLLWFYFFSFLSFSFGHFFWIFSFTSPTTSAAVTTSVRIYFIQYMRTGRTCGVRSKPHTL